MRERARVDPRGERRTGSREEAVELAHRIHGEVEPGGELVYEVQPQNPFAVFGGLGT